MTKYLYILCEGEKDEMFYEHVAERVTGMSFSSDTDFRLRHGSNWKTAIAQSRLLLNRVRKWSGRHDVAIIIAVDNDRSPGHPGGNAYPKPLSQNDMKKSSRYQELSKLLADSLGAERKTWPVEIAVAMPVEMIESWVLTLLNPSHAADLPIFSRADSHSAKAYHGKNPPLQLKDLCDDEAKNRGVEPFDLVWLASEQPLPPARAASRSFDMFLSDLKQWKTC